MTFTPKESKYGGVDEETLKKEGQGSYLRPEAGPQYLLIEDAFEGTDDWGREIKRITFRSMFNEAKFFITKYMKNKDNDNLNYYTMHWLNSLGYAVCGIRTDLDPTDLIGRIVMAEVKLEPAWKDKKQYEADIREKGESDIPVYPNIDADSIEPVTEAIVEEYCSEDKQDQFFLPDE